MSKCAEQRIDTVIARNFLAATILTAATLSASALSLGSSHGAAVLGSPLDLAFAVREDTGRDLDASCFSANVDMGGTRVAAHQVSTTLLPGSGGAVQLRVRTTMPVDEPVVVVRLEATCGGRIARSYTFLTELPGNVSGRIASRSISVVAPVGSPALSDDVVATSESALTQRPSRSSAGASVRSERKRRSVPAGKEQASGPKARQLAPQAVVQAAPAASPKLVVEPLELWTETPAKLRLSFDLPAFEETGDVAVQRKAAKAMWLALNAKPQEIEESAAIAAQAQQQVAALQEQLRKEQAAGLEARRQLERLDAENFSAWVVYALAGLLAVALLGFAWLQWKRRSLDAAQAWHGGALQAGDAVEESLDELVGITVWPQTEAAMEEVPPKPVGGNGDVFSPPTASVGSSVAGPFIAAATLADSAAEVEMGAPSPALQVQEIEHPEDLFDVLQQAEFFISIGEHEQAVDGLCRHIAQRAGSSPLAYLELLRLYHTLGRVSAFDELRTGFEERFNAQVPSFATFQRGGKSLEDYPGDLERIQSSWGSEEVVDGLGKLMFRPGAGADMPRFDLPAYEDLLLLLAIAQTTFGKGRSGATAAAPAPAPMGRPSLDTLAGDLMLEPAGHSPARSAPPAPAPDEEGATLPNIVAPELDLGMRDRADGSSQLSLEPRDLGRRPK